jgi:hypothetical protein
MTMDKITLPELPMLPNPGWSGNEIAFQCHEYALAYAKTCCAHVLTVAAFEVTKIEGLNSTEDDLLSDVGFVIRDLIEKL